MAKKDVVKKVFSTVMFLIVLVIIFFSACSIFKAQCGIDIFSKIFKPKPTPVSTISIAPTEAEKQISVAYKGTLPCADCPGLDTELILKKANIDSIDGTYITKETYLERNVDPIITEGTWQTLFSSIKGKPIVIIQLNSGKPESVRYFLQINNNEIKMLDKNKDEIIAENINFSLYKINN